jgi:hypothetical protein
MEKEQPEHTIRKWYAQLGAGMSSERHIELLTSFLEEDRAVERARIRETVEGLKHVNDGSYGNESALLDTGFNAALQAVLDLLKD